MLQRRRSSTSRSWSSIASGSGNPSPTRLSADLLMPYYKYSCRRPLFHDAYLPSLNRANVTIVDCPVGIDHVTERGVVVDGHEYELDCIVYATGFEPEVTPLPRRARTRDHRPRRDDHRREVGQRRRHPVRLDDQLGSRTCS